MYKPNFCAECGVHILRAKWRVWNSRRFCDDCRSDSRRARFVGPLIAVGLLLATGFGFGRYLRPGPPPLVIQRFATSPLSDLPLTMVAGWQALPNKGVTQSNSIDSGGLSDTIEEVVYTCGARTKKGAPCLRRVHAPVRCWQHKGRPAMVPQEKLLVKE